MNPQQQDPLAQLRDIHLAGEPSWWPLAPGWWIVIVLSLLALYFSWKWYVKAKTRRLPAKITLQKLESVFHQWQADNDDRQYLTQANTTIKQFCMHLFGRQQIASLHSDNWLDFLQQQSSSTLSHETLSTLGKARYQSHIEADVAGIHKQLCSWIQKNKSSSPNLVHPTQEGQD